MCPIMCDRPIGFRVRVESGSRKPSGRRVPVVSLLLRAVLRNTWWRAASSFLRPSAAICSVFPEIGFPCRRNGCFRKRGGRSGFVSWPIRCSPLARTRFLGCHFLSYVLSMFGVRQKKMSISRETSSLSARRMAADGRRMELWPARRAHFRKISLFGNPDRAYCVRRPHFGLRPL